MRFPDGHFHPGYLRAVEVFGSASAIAGALTISRQAVSGWRFTGVPAERAVQLEKLSGGKARALELVEGPSAAAASPSPAAAGHVSMEG